jgi:hypothetical protein
MLFCLVVAPTRKLVNSLKDSVNASFELAGLETRCVSYRDEDVTRETRGVIACCTHSLHKFTQGDMIQMLIGDEVAESIESVSHLDPAGLFNVLNAMKHAALILWADAMAGASVADALRHLNIPPSRYIVLDTPEKRPYRGAPFEIIIPVNKTGKIEQNAAIAALVEECKAGRNVLMTCCTVFEVRLAERVLQNEGISCRVAHSLLAETDKYVAAFQVSRRDQASFLVRGGSVAPLRGEALH